jgi:L-lactate permease
MVASNSSGGVTGKMISPQSITVAWVAVCDCCRDYAFSVREKQRT